MASILQAVSGYKTYIVAAAAGVDAFGVALGWWEENRIREIVEGLFTVIFLRMGVQKSGPVEPKA